MRRITTSNSVYEVDDVNMRVRRVSGLNDPTRYIGKDGEWRDYEYAYATSFGGLVFIAEGGKGIVTSKIVKEENL